MCNLSSTHEICEEVYLHCQNHRTPAVQWQGERTTVKLATSLELERRIKKPGYKIGLNVMVFVVMSIIQNSKFI